MGLFDKRDTKKKKSDDFDSPIEKIDLSAPAEPAVPAAATVKTARPVAAAAAAPLTAEPARTPRAMPAPRMEPEPMYDSGFGIEKAIELMRTLPQDNVELVVQVVKLTLESTQIKISTIIEDASRKQSDIQGRIKVLSEEISDFEKEISQRRQEIETLQADHQETSTVKDRLQLAEKLGRGGSAPAPGPATNVTSGGMDSANASGSIGGITGQTGKTSVVVKK